MEQDQVVMAQHCFTMPVPAALRCERIQLRGTEREKMGKLSVARKNNIALLQQVRGGQTLSDSSIVGLFTTTRPSNATQTVSRFSLSVKISSFILHFYLTLLTVFVCTTQVDYSSFRNIGVSVQVHLDTILQSL